MHEVLYNANIQGSMVSACMVGQIIVCLNRHALLTAAVYNNSQVWNATDKSDNMPNRGVLLIIEIHEIHEIHMTKNRNPRNPP